MTVILKQFQATPPPASLKAVEEICVTCGGAHPYYQCLATGGNTFPELRDNIQRYVSAAAVNYNQGNFVYRPPGIANQIRPLGFAQPNVQNNQNRFGQPQGFNRGNNFNPEQSYQAPTQQNQIVPLNELEKVKRMHEDNMKAMQTQINMVKNELRNEMKNSIQVSLSNQTNEIKNMMASLFQINTASTSGSGSLPSNTVANPKGELKAITTRSGIVLDGPTVPTSSPFINLKEDERVEETLTDPDLSEYTVKVPPPPLLINITLADALILMPNGYPEKVTRKLRDPKKFLISCGFSELKCKAIADLGASINLMPLSIWKNLGLPELISTCMSLELANRAICTPTGIARDVFVPVGKFIFPSNFVIVNYESDPRVPLILGRPFLRTARALIDVHGEEMILGDGDERLTLNMRHATSSYYNQPHKESINLINVFNNSSEDFLEDLFLKQPSGNPTFSSHPELTSSEVKDDIFDSEGGNVLPEKLLDLDFTKDLHPPLHFNPLSGNTTYSSFPNPLLELALITFPPKYDDDLQFDVESDLKEIEFLLHQDIDSSLKDSINQSNLANPAENFVDSMPEMFTDEHALDYSSPSIFDEHDDDFLEVESETENAYDDPFDSKGEKIKESKLLIDELDLPCDFLPPSEYDSFIS
nr:reverse transcriptase domain-containing protein [Tanacetum cinerariifolium]